MSVDSNDADAGPQLAKELLDDLHSREPVARVAAYVATGAGQPSGEDFLRTLAFAKDRLCLTVTLNDGIEYIWLAEGWGRFVGKTVKDDGRVWGPWPLEPDELENRLGKSIGVELADETPVERPTSGGDR